MAEHGHSDTRVTAVRSRELTAARLFTQRHFNRSIAQLQQFIGFPSVSRQPRHAADVRRCAHWLANHLRSIGLQRVETVATAGHPIVFATHWCSPLRPTVLLYGHYDVHPVTDAGWATPPFKAVRINDSIHGRGASDNKGQLFTHVKAIESLLRTSGQLPVNLICVYEGEEEVGSPNIADFLLHHCSRLHPDVAVISDTKMPSVDQPAVTYALRGAMTFSIEARGSHRDLHPGTYGGAIHNPLLALCEILARLHDRHGRILIPGFYRDVRDWEPSERLQMSLHGPTPGRLLHNAGVLRGWGDPRYSEYERTTIRPALNVTDIFSRAQGHGAHTTIPARAIARIDLRIVPDQHPREIERLFRTYIERLTPATLAVQFRTGLRIPPSFIDRSHPVMLIAGVACRLGFGVEPVFLRSGGTIPIVNLLQNRLGIPTVLLGFATPGDRDHASNERFHLTGFFRGILTVIAFLVELRLLSPVSHPRSTRHSLQAIS